MKKYFTEGIGAFFLVLTAVLTIGNNGGGQAPLAIGAMLMVMTYSGSHISGAHFNPAVSLAVLMRGKLERFDFPYYCVAQFIGSGFAALLATFLARCSGSLALPLRTIDPICALVAEFLGTFALVFVFLNTHTARSNAGNSYFGLATGFAVIAGMYALGGISGGVFNPVLAFGYAIAGLVDWGVVWVYLAGTLLGAAAAASVFRVVYGEQDE